MSGVRVEVVTDAGAVLAGTLTDESVERLRDALDLAVRPQRLGTYAEAAAILGLSEAAARKHGQRGHLPLVRVGGRVLIDLDQLDAS